jgi:hypothetical protein
MKLNPKWTMWSNDEARITWEGGKKIKNILWMKEIY